MASNPRYQFSYTNVIIKIPSSELYNKRPVDFSTGLFITISTNYAKM